MEVHHRPDLHHRKKHFIEYFLEFLMIFLAVTLGFFAENVRESISNHSKEKEYIKSYAEDLDADMLTVDYTKPLIMKIVTYSDTLLDLLKTPDSDINHIYFLANKSRGLYVFVRHDKTIQQIKNQGGFSVITNKEFVEQITSYDADIDVLNNIVRGADMKQLEKIDDLAAQIFDANILRIIYPKKTFQEVPANLHLLSNDKVLLNKYSYFIQRRIVYLNYEVQDLDDTYNAADSTIEFLISKYSFIKDEELNNNNYLQRRLEEVLNARGRDAFINQYKLFRAESKIAMWKGISGILNGIGYDLLNKK